METKQPSFTILLFPWLAHGHIYPYLELAKNLSTKNFKIFFCSTPNNLNSITDALQNTPYSDSIHLLELHLPPLPDLPQKYHLTSKVPANLLHKLHEAFHMSESNFSAILASLKPDLLIYDLFQTWAPTVASSQGIPAVHFATTGAAAYSFFYHVVTNGHSPFPYDAMHLRDYELEEFLTLHVSDNPEPPFNHFNLSSNIILMRTCKGIEGKYMDYLSTLCHKKIVPVGPIIAPPVPEKSQSKIMQWLATKERFSTVFISFGSENYLSKNQITEVAKGLEASNVNFIWVVKFTPGVEASIDEALPEGFVERVKERGMIVQGWVPQTTILGHPSIGAFVSHCGMSSTIESAYFGVPVIGLPFRIDQPLNAKLLVEEGVGIEVKRGPNGHFTSEEIVDVLNKVFIQKTGEEMRLKAAELSKKMKNEEEYAMSEVAEQLRQICIERKQQKAMTESESI